MKKNNSVTIALAIAFALVFAFAFSSCRTQKDGCGSYGKWESKTKFRGGN